MKANTRFGAVAQIARLGLAIFCVLYGALIGAGLTRAQSVAPLLSAQKKLTASADYGRLPLSFEKNEGQADPSVKFLSHGQGYSLSLASDGAFLVLHKGKDSGSAPESEATPQIKLIGSNPHPEIVGMEELPGKVNYLLGNDPKKWRTNLPTYAKVLYKNVYPGIDLTFRGNQGKLEFDFTLRPGANPDLIQIFDPGMNLVKVNEAGDLVMQVRGGDILLKKPVTYQESDRGRVELASNFAVKDNDRITFHVGPFDRSKELVIDPQLVYSTYLDGATTLPVRATAIAVDGLGEAIITGQAESSYAVTPGALEANAPFVNYNPFVAKLNASGTALVYATYLGGSASTTQGPDGITAVAADSAGNAYVTGGATSLDFPVTSTAFQATAPCPTTNETGTHLCKASSAFVTELNPNGNGLVYSTYLGGTTGVASGGVLAQTAFVPFGSFVPADTGSGIAVDPSGGIYVAGLTTSTDFPITAGAPQTGAIVGTTTPLGRASFIAKLNPASSGPASLVYSTYFGSTANAEQGSGSDTQIAGIAVDSVGNVYVTGFSNWGPSNTPLPTTAGSFEPVAAPVTQFSGLDTSFVAKLNSLGTKLSYSTFFQGGVVGGFQTGGQTETTAIAVDASGSAYITGFGGGGGTAGVGSVPTTPGAFQTSCNDVPSIVECSDDAFVAKFSPDGSSLVYSTYLGGSGTDIGYGIAVDAQGHAIVVGQTAPDNSGVPNTFPTTPDALQVTCPAVVAFSGGCGNNGFLTVMSADGSSLIYSTFLGGTSGLDQPFGVAADTAGNAYLTGYTESSDFPTTPGAFVGSLKQTEGSFAMKFGTSVVASPITVLPNALLSGALLVPYGPVTFTQTGGTGTITWTETGALPTGINFTNGLLQGTPTQSGTFPISVTATDASSNHGTVNLSLTVGVSLGVSPTSVPTGGVNLSYTVIFTATGATGTITWTETGALPTGLTLSSDGVLSGTPTVSGTFPLQITATDANNNSGTVSVSLLIYPGSTASVSLAPCSATATGASVSVNFGNVATGSTATQIVCVNNTGSNILYVGALISFSLPISPISVASDGCTILASGPTPTNGLLPGQSCQITFQFKPTAIASTSPSLEILDSGGSQTVNFTGAGVAPPFAFYSPTQLNFGNVVQNTTVNQNVTVTNTGTGPLTINVIFFGLAATPGFSYSQIVCNGVIAPTGFAGPFTLNPAQSCTVTVQFKPPSTGPFSAGLAFGDNAASGQSNLPTTSVLFSAGQVVALSGTGITAGPPPDFTISSTPVTVTAGNSGQSTVTVSPLNGFADAVNLSVSGTPAGVTANFNTNPVTGGSGTSTLTLGTTSATATGTFNLTVTGTDTSGSPSHGTPLSLTVNAAGGGGGTPGCACSKTGSYVAPNNGSAPTSLTVSGGSVTVTSGGNTVFTLSSLPSGTAAGLSPDNATLEVNEPGQGVSLYNLTSTPPGKLIGPSPLISNATGAPSRIQFSPSGQYLAYMTAATPVGGQNGSATIVIYNVRTGKMVYENSNFTFLFPSGGTSGIQDASGNSLSVDAFGTVGDWGFSPDAPETSFVYGFLTDASSIQWNLVHLEQPPTSNTIGSAKTISLTNITAAFWQFSPCGDVIGIVTQPSGFAEIQFIRTVDGTQVGDFSGIPVGNITFSSNSTDQVATDLTSSGPQTYTVADSSFNLGCSAQNAPAGSNVTVQPAATGSIPSGTLSAPVTLSFPSMNQPGGQVSLSVSNTGAAPPSGFEIGSPAVYYDLTTSPDPLPFGGSITICINYTGITFSGQPTLYHIVNGAPTNITTTVDTANHIICGITPSLSPFVIFGAAGLVNTTTGLGSSLNPSVAGQTVTFTAQVSPGIAGSPSGTVTFSDGSTAIGTGTLDSTGNATFATTTLAAGSHSVTAEYSGDTYFAPSTSAPLVQQVSFTAAQISVTASGLLYSRVTKLFSGTVTIKNAGSSPIAGPFNLALTGLPSGVTLVNPTGTFNASPYVTVPSVTSLAAGQSTTITLSFTDPSMTKITFAPVVYTGAL